MNQEQSLTVVAARPSSDLTTASLHDLAGQLAPRSQRIYRLDAQHFAAWLAERGLDLATVSRSDIIEYRSHLAERYAKVTAARMLTVARRLLDEATRRAGGQAVNPAADVKGFKSAGNETPHVALSKLQARELLESIDRSTPAGQRDYALIMLLLRTGLRRSEAAALTLADLATEQGHNIVIIRHGKGDKRRIAKLPVDVARAIQTYLEAAGRAGAGPDTPLFVRFRQKGKGGPIAPVEDGKGLSDKGIETIVKARAAAVGIAGLTPHGLRASFVTLTLEGGAKLQQVQYAAGHADPRTTERYQKRKINLDDNATDYLRF